MAGHTVPIRRGHSLLRAQACAGPRSFLYPSCGLCVFVLGVPWGRFIPGHPHVDLRVRAASCQPNPGALSTGKQQSACPLKPAAIQTLGGPRLGHGVSLAEGTPHPDPEGRAPGGAAARRGTGGPSPHPALSLAALADFDEPKRSTLVMFGVLTIAVRIYHDRWGYGVYSGPIGTAVLIIAAKWVRTVRARRSGAPSPDGDSSPSGSPSTSCHVGRQAGHRASANTQKMTVGCPSHANPVCFTSVLTSSGPDPSHLTALPQFPYL